MGKRPSQPRTIRRWALLVYWTVMFVATHYPGIDELEPETGWPIPKFETVMHVGVYAGWAAMWWWVLSAGGRRVSPAAINWLVLGGLAYAVFDEASQAIVGRTPGVNDFLADVAGLAVAVIVLHTWQQRRLPRPRR